MGMTIMAEATVVVGTEEATVTAMVPAEAKAVAKVSMPPSAAWEPLL